MAAKIKDGLFIGDAETSQDPEFLELNKISNLVNLSGREVPNSWAAHGLVYLTYNWEDRADFLIWVDQDESIADLVEFVDASIRHGVAVLLFSRRGVGRSAVAVCAYLMTKYHWGFEKTYDFVYSKKPDIDINKGFVQQLFALDKRLRSARNQQLKLSIDDSTALAAAESMRQKDWDPSYLEYDKMMQAQAQSTGRHSRRDDLLEDTPDDELLMIFSFLNSKQNITSLPGPYRSAIDTPKNFKLRFNSELQEEDIHMFPTSPPKGNVYRKGVIKGTYVYPPLTSSSSTSSLRDNGRRGESNPPRNVQYDDKGPNGYPPAQQQQQQPQRGGGTAPPSRVPSTQTLQTLASDLDSNSDYKEDARDRDPRLYGLNGDSKDVYGESQLSVSVLVLVLVSVPLMGFRPAPAH